MKMDFISNNKVDRTIVKLGEFELVRIKNYDSNRGITKISWRFKDDGSVVDDGYSEKLERKFIRNSRDTHLVSVSR